MDIEEMMAGEEVPELMYAMFDATARADAARRTAGDSLNTVLARVLERVSDAMAKLPAYEVRMVTPELCDKIESFRRATNEFLATIEGAFGNIHRDCGHRD